MGTIQQELFSRAAELVERHLSEDELFKRVWQEMLVVLSGSAATEFADKYSSIDLVAVLPDSTYNKLRSELRARGFGRRREHFVEAVFGGVHFKCAIYSEDEVTTWLRSHDDFAMALLHDSLPIHDPLDRFEELVGGKLGYPGEVLKRKIEARFSELRRRQASMAWNLRRGQPFVFLDNLVRLMSHAFCICLYLEGRPPVGRKWLFRAAMRTETGRRLRPIILELFGVLGDLTTLGGTINVRTSALYTRVDLLQQLLAEAIEEQKAGGNT